MRYYLGLDNGGTNTKAALFTPDGTQVAVESVATAALTPARCMRASRSRTGTISTA